MTTAQDTTPDAFSFTDVTVQPLNTQISSDTVNITGITGNVSVSVTGDGSPEISINGGAWTTSGTITNGQTLQVRLTSANANMTTSSATVTVGTGSATWNVTTLSGPPTGCPTIGDVCSDGSYYVGQIGGNSIYASDAASKKSSLSWNNGTTSYATTGFTSTTDGPGNTAGLVAATGNSDYPYQAAAYCDGLSADGHADWYLPAKDELNLFWNGGSRIASTTKYDTYWSSTEATNSNAWGQNYFSGGLLSLGKSSSSGNYWARCVRR